MFRRTQQTRISYVNANQMSHSFQDLQGYSSIRSEQLSHKQPVLGSNPSSPTIFKGTTHER